MSTMTAQISLQSRTNGEALPPSTTHQAGLTEATQTPGLKNQLPLKPNQMGASSSLLKTQTLITALLTQTGVFTPLAQAAFSTGATAAGERFRSMKTASTRI